MKGLGALDEILTNGYAKPQDQGFLTNGPPDRMF